MSPSSPQQPGADLPPDFETNMPGDIEVRYCYRHRDRETGVSCTSCGRPICHDCMIPAAVGFRCPECMREQNPRGTRAKVVTRSQTRSRWQGPGGMLGSQGFSITKLLLVINIAYFVVEILTGATGLVGGGNVVQLVRLGALVPAYVAIENDYWRMFTSVFMHSGLLHILFNMWALLVIGNFLESALGRSKFLTVYLLSGFAGSVLVLVAAPVMAATIGASGALFGVFGALGVYSFLNRHRDFTSRAVLNQIVFLLLINLVFTFGFAGRISWQAHIGGLLGGALTMYALMLGGSKDPRGRFDRTDIIVVVLVAAVLVGITWWRVTNFPLF